MATELFPMYCGLSGISGMDHEKDICDAILRLSRASEKVIVLIPINGDAEWVYGQCNFRQDTGHSSDFKFSNTRAALREQNVIPSLINSHGVDSVLFTDAEQYNWFRSDAAFRKYREYFAQLKLTSAGYSR